MKKQRRRSINRNNKKTSLSKKIIIWSPRILSIIFILFLSLFSLDVFDPELNFLQIILALFMHNIPSLILLVVLILSWNREWIGGIAFILAGILYITVLAISMIKNPPFQWYFLSWSLIVAGPAILTGILFLISGYRKEK